MKSQRTYKTLIEIRSSALYFHLSATWCLRVLVAKYSSENEITKNKMDLLKSKYKTLSAEEERIGKILVNSALKVHKALGPGLLEKIYEIALEHELKKAGLLVERQTYIPIIYDGIEFEEGLRLDLFIEGLVICEIKSVEQVNPVWEAQVLSHLKLTGRRLGYVINFNVPLIKGGINRLIL